MTYFLIIFDHIHTPSPKTTQIDFLHPPHFPTHPTLSCPCDHLLFFPPILPPPPLPLFLDLNPLSMVCAA